MYRKPMILVSLLVLSLACHAHADVPQGVNLATLNGWDIVVAEDAIPSELYAAEQFQQYITQAGGPKLPIVTTTDRPQQHIFIGLGKAFNGCALAFTIDEFGPEDLRIVIRDENIAIAGGRPRGTLYGVYSFLEDYLGVRFLTADHTHVPPIGPWRIVGPVDRFYHPPLGFRWSYYGETNRDPIFASRLRVNTVGNEPKVGGITGLTNINHSFARQIPTQEYGKDHPEYYCLRNGKRLANVKSDAYDSEPCLTNPDVLRIVTQAVLEQLTKNPNAGNVSVSQNDNDKYCQCPQCAAIDEREGTPMGSLLLFVNAIAEEVAKKYPNTLVGTLSYWYTRKPPKTIRPRPNVQIQLCSIECCLIHSIDNPACPLNVEFCQDMADWGKLSDNITIWNYNTNFSNYQLPCPNLRVIEPNVRYFVANNAKGIFMQAAGNALGAELSDLRNYVIANILWDPTRNARELLDEFLVLHYAQAAPPIRRFIDLVHDRAEASGVHKNCFGKAKDYGIGESIAKEGLASFAQAMKLAQDATIRSRVEKASICAYRLAVEPIWKIKDKADLNPELAQRMRPLVIQFLQLCKQHGVTSRAIA